MLLLIRTKRVLLIYCGAQPDANVAGNAPEDAGVPVEGKDLIGFCSVNMSESICVHKDEVLRVIFGDKAEVQTVSCDNDTLQRK